MACFSEQMRPTCTCPSWRAKTWGLSMAVSVMPMSWNLRFFPVVSCDDEEPGAVGRAVDVGRLNGPVDPLFLRGQLVEVPFHGGGQGLDDILQRIPVGPAVEIKEQDRDLGVRQEQGVEVALAQVFRNGVVVGEVTVVDQRLVETDKRMRPGRVPDSTLGGVPLVRDPDVGLEVVQLVVLDHLLGIADDLQDEKIPAMGEDKGLLFSIGVIVGLVEPVGVLINKLVFHLSIRRVR